MEEVERDDEEMEEKEMGRKKRQDEGEVQHVLYKVTFWVWGLDRAGALGSSLAAYPPHTLWPGCFLGCGPWVIAVVPADHTWVRV